MPHKLRTAEDIWAAPYRVVRPRTWSDLVKSLVASTASTGWIFRGVADSRWDLDANLTRLLKAPSSPWPDDEWEMAERAAIGYFKVHARAELTEHPEDGDLLGWLGLMRHYGAPTRLLDWTMSPFVACYFAFESLTDTRDAALWGLQAFYCRVVSAPTATYPHDEAGTWPSGDPPRFLAMDRTRSEAENLLLRIHMRNKSTWPVPLVPNWIDARMAAQQALFTAVGDLKRAVNHLWQPSADPQHSAKLQSLNSIQNHVTEPRLQRLKLSTSDVQREDQILRKVLLPAAWRADALDTLDRMGINRRSLFPGLDGLGAGTAENLSRQTYGLRDLLSPMLREVDFPQDP